jgi:putative two-component system response regulator
MHRILFVDDEPNIRTVFQRFFESTPEYTIDVAENFGNALKMAGEGGYDLIVTDVTLPDRSGIDLLKSIREVDQQLMVIVITGNPSLETAIEAVHEGAFDYLRKPFTMHELGETMKRALKKKVQSDSQKRLAEIERSYIDSLESTLHEQTREIRKAYAFLKESHIKSLEILASAADYRDDDTGVHIKRIGGYSSILAKNLGLSDQEVEMLLHAAPMHDVGKIGIPDSVLQKPGRLSPEEFEVIKTHTVVGAKIFFGSKHPYHIASGIICMSHHERWDGNGYPRKIGGKEIHIFGRIVAVVDVYDALVTKRVYKDAWPEAKAIDLIRSESGRQFDPFVVECFLRSIDEIHECRDMLETSEVSTKLLDASTLMTDYEAQMDNEV